MKNWKNRFFILGSKIQNGFKGIPRSWQHLVAPIPKKFALNKDEDAMVKELKSQASTQKFFYLDAVMAELKYWMMRLITDEDYEL